MAKPCCCWGHPASARRSSWAVCSPDAKTPNPRQQSDHRMDAAIESLFQPLQARGLDLPDLVGEQAQPCPLAPQLGQCVRRHRLAFPAWAAARAAARPCTGSAEAADAEACECALDPVADARAFADKVLALAVRPLRLLLFQARDRRHAAVVPLTAQPAEKAVFQQPRVEPIGFCPAMFCAERRCRSADRASPGKAPASMPCARNAMP